MRFSAQSSRTMAWSLLLISACVSVGTSQQVERSEGATITGSAKALDGDSILVGSGKSVVDVRLFGIDAPEPEQECKRTSEVWDCGQQATNELAALVDGRTIRCDVVELERAGARRPIARCFVDRKSVNDEMLRRGMAWAFRKYLSSRPGELAHYAALEAEAKASNIGVWDGGSSVAPWEFRERRWDYYAARSKREGCPIIGNKRAKHAKYYHTPWSPNYKSMFERLVAGRRPDPSKEWLCDETEAVLKGYKRAYAR